jgi:hypothetical protein
MSRSGNRDDRDEPGFLQKLPQAAGAVTGSLTAAAGGIGAAAGRLVPDVRPGNDSGDRARVEAASAGQEASSAPVIVGSPSAAPKSTPAPKAVSAPVNQAAATAPQVAAAEPEPKSGAGGFSLPWNRAKSPTDGLQQADTTIPPPEPSADPKDQPPAKSKSEPRPSRVTIAGLGRGQGGTKVPDGPLAPQQFQVVQNPSGTEFYPYDSPTPVPKILPEGGLVEVTKPGDEWSGIVLPDGSEGIVRTSMLRRARISEMPREAFEEPSIAMPPQKPVNYEASANLTLPDLPTPDETSMPLGQGLLPPLQQDN